ncbi:thioredoxin domain-containing protein [Polyangium sorediatum]|uniref:Thioredoxin domain-containing protein n=1 Tax=Polyangium sorediatum TaxID=889274 RepID=A0ABT6NVQ2_9BACT|nr:thioredoxin domain-containing protein [Polyangium sorediatum]MDI1432384.1 thioredoxin domain-containing protein [Polyangium sorediatum]
MSAHENRLAKEKSPYLLQHARNPVDWYPWGAEALERAKREDKPLLLSIGYAACHWCHVMERESFENDAIAARMNELFVNVKVDREERPDLDQVYQLVVQLMGRSGGWPLTVFLTPDQKPFFAGTYFPPADKYGVPGFPAILEAVADAYKRRRGEVLAQAGEITQEITRVGALPEGEGEIGQDLLRKACRRLLARFDSHNGGFGARPKFPNTMSLDVLLLRGTLEGDAVSKESVELALDKMQKGGIWDHLRGGFHRYSTDARWLVPHFEKMLYDNALLLRLYVDGYRALGNPRFAETARALVAYLFAEMRDASGAFYATQDADSEGQEGKFFVWKLGDLRAAVGDDHEAYEVARVHFGITDEGNFEETGATVLSEVRSIERTAAIVDLAPGAATSALERARTKMLAAREKRPRPTRDDKILASWNALLIGALAEAGRALDEPSWIGAAEVAFAAIEERLVRDGRVRRYYMPGENEAPEERRGFLDDQAYVGSAALDLYEATGNPRYVALARAIADAMIEHHEDPREGGFFFAPDDGDALIARTKDVFDQAVPSGASMAAELCLRLGEITDERFAAHGRRQIEPIGPTAIDNPLGLGKAVAVLDRLVRGTVDVVLVGDPSGERAQAFAKAVFRRFLPHRNVVWVDPRRPETAEAVKVLAEGKGARGDDTVAYVCRNRTCSAPVSDVAALEALLDRG